MSIFKKTKEDFLTSHWSGGTTTQLYIHPEGSSLSERNFDLRISTATIEIEESEFTALPGYDRILMVLDGELLIEHIGRYSISLGSLKKDSFQGAWETRSKGKAIDFNLIYKPILHPKLTHSLMDEGDSIQLNDCAFNILFVHEGSFQINETKYNKGEIALIEAEENVKLEAIENTVIILVTFENSI